MGCVDCGGDNNWHNCDALEIEKGEGRDIFVVQAHRDGKRFIVRAEEKLTAFLELETAIRAAMT
jgi:hypothetical protein